MISADCKKSVHDDCTIDLGNNHKCECSCHVSKITPKSMQQEKDKHGITREDELRAETIP
ncbi:MAG TPA: hypothetical protein VFJ51_08005 [Nitrososphaeraceae archaeon]|jgi:hypothetical protein|nr:hypothetical protein [Nitrososphaeraceae archaeon]